MRLLVLTLFLAIAPLQAAADGDIRERVIQELRDDGYQDIRIFRTFLGRLRFIARDADTRREIVVNPSTGVILRDFVRAINTSSTPSGSVSDGQSSRGSFDNDDDDDDDDDDGGSDSGGGSDGDDGDDDD